MRPFLTILAAAALLIQLLPVPASSAEQTLIPANSLWKFNDKGTNLGTSWRGTAYNDSSWSQGNAQLGYGDGDESTVLGFGSSNNRYITYYFRKTFTVSNLASISGLTLRYLRDDGCVIYVNGAEVLRSNMPTGTISSSTRAVTGLGEPEENAWLQTTLSKSFLVGGNNVIAVEVHQQSPTSSDVSFNLELRATIPSTAPLVTLTSPAHQSTVNTGTVSFNASVSAASGLSSATLLLAPAPVTLTFTGPAQIEDAQLTADTPTTPNGSAAAVNVDGQTPHAHGLLRAPTLIGNGAGQVPPGTVIQSATLLLNCTNSGQAMQLFRLTESWVEDQASWNERQIGVPWSNPGADGAGSNAQTAVAGDCTATGVRSIDITTFVQQWSSGSPNHGVLLADSGTDGIDFDSSESPASPQITVVYKPAAQEIGTQSLSGTSASVSFNASLAVGQTYSWNVRATDTQGQQSTAGSDFLLTVDAASPDAPTLISPANGATGVPVSTALQVGASNPTGGALTVNFQLRQPPAPEFTVIALPDTQNYAEFYPDIFTNQTQWIASQKAARNIVFVTQEGDLVNHANSTIEYDRAKASMALLDGVVPYGIAPGNHDEPTTLFNQYFPYTDYLGVYPWYGGHHLNLNDNSYQLFSAGGMDFVIVHLDFCPLSAVVSWADSIYKQYPNRIGMMTTHGYLSPSAQRSVGGCTDTQYLWDGLAVPNPNLHFMFSGHVHPNGEARRADVIHGHPVHQVTADYQDRAQGGEGWLRIMRFVPADNKIYVQTYSPWLNQYETDANSQFTLDFPMGGAFAGVGSVVVPSGSAAAMPLSGLNPDQLYEWRAVVTNAAGKTTTGPSWTFRTAAVAPPVNQAPTANSASYNTAAATPVAITLTGSDPESNPLTYSIAGSPVGGLLSGTPPSVTYTPNAGFSGAGSFTFRTHDGTSQSNLATISITVAAPPAPTPDAATFVKLDSTTQGSWKGVYGLDGSTILGNSTNYPAYVTATPSGHNSYTWVASTADPRAMQKAAGSDRIAACWYSGGVFNIDLLFSDGAAHSVALYLLDWDAGGRSQRVEILGSTGTVLDTRTVSGFGNGQYLVWNLSGHVVIRVTNLNGSSNAVVSGLLFGGAGAPPPPPTPGTASFVKVDTTTQGSWKGVYGSGGSNILGDSTNYPAYVTTTPSGHNSYTWTGSTADVRGMQKFSGSDRIAACWYSGGGFTIDLVFSDSATHQLALYLLDWDAGGRSQRVEILNGAGTVLDTRTVSGFGNGQYLVWNLTGHVTVRVTNLNGSSNAVVSGLLFQ